MSRRIGGALVLTLLAVAVAGCGKTTPSGEGGSGGPSATSIDGTYTITGMELDGKKMADAELDKFMPPAERTVVIKGDKMTMNKGEKDDTITIKVNPSKTPAEIDATETKPGGKTETTYGIYKLEGDTLTFCIDLGGKSGESKPENRPKDFKPTENNMIMTMKKK